jgi:hypothetical protein
MKHVELFEKCNETFFFQFGKAGEAMHNTALYLAVKKAFTPFAALHTLKQI